MSVLLSQHSGYRLLHQGILALSQIEANGMKIDVEYVRSTDAEIGELIKTKRKQLAASEFGARWKKKFGAKTNFGARAQLGQILFSPKKYGGLGLIPREVTEKGGRAKTDESALEGIGVPEVELYLDIERLATVKNTFLAGILREVDEDGLLHPVFNLHTTQTYRSSSDTPNFQNLPVRNPELGRLVRRSFVSRFGKNGVIVENDFKGVEVSVSACYHKDPVFISYIKDSTKDMHRDMAMQIYCVTPEQWKRMEEKKEAKAVRHASKNQFVFPQFYGDWYMSCARYLWEEIDKRKFTVDDVPMKKHLKKHGITELGNMEKDSEGNYPSPEPGTFVHHIKEIENDFWNNRFRAYGKWRRKWYDKYLERGYFDTYTGFRIGGAMGRNAVINYPVQGSAFHCLLWSLVQLQKELKRRKMKTKICGQIHDSIVADVHVDELDEYLKLVAEITMSRLEKHFKWITVPLVIECEIAPAGKTWYDKREVKMTKQGVETKDGYKGTARGLIDFWNKLEKDRPKKNS